MQSAAGNQKTALLVFQDVFVVGQGSVFAAAVVEFERIVLKPGNRVGQDSAVMVKVGKSVLKGGVGVAHEPDAATTSGVGKIVFGRPGADRYVRGFNREGKIKQAFRDNRFL